MPWHIYCIFLLDQRHNNSRWMLHRYGYCLIRFWTLRALLGYETAAYMCRCFQHTSPCQLLFIRCYYVPTNHPSGFPLQICIQSLPEWCSDLWCNWLHTSVSGSSAVRRTIITGELPECWNDLIDWCGNYTYATLSSSLSSSYHCCFCVCKHLLCVGRGWQIWQLGCLTKLN